MGEHPMGAEPTANTVGRSWPNVDRWGLVSMAW